MRPRLAGEAVAVGGLQRDAGRLAADDQDGGALEASGRDRLLALVGQEDVDGLALGDELDVELAGVRHPAAVLAGGLVGAHGRRGEQAGDQGHSR
ncbi:hypothetical protein BK022_21455 [Methylorubrum extorquens]|uniref:Uncharacterized protein n=1 Tax=Methylorubrum extorquens TaxID=408 RepID=A0A1S1P0D6_METEX|nr:hypothetical protein BK022_21455 [Methylorubrum extorquens]